MALVVEVPTAYVGDLLSDLSMQRRARIGDVDAQEGIGRTVIKAQVPFATMLGYASAIRSMTQGNHCCRRLWLVFAG
jgi:elongation factor G